MKSLPEIGEEVTVIGEFGCVFTVLGIRDEKDGPVVSVWGGSRNPNGHRSYRFFTLDRIKPAKKGRKRK